MEEKYRMAYAEVNEILKLSSVEVTNKIPYNFRRKIIKNMDKNYVPNITPKKDFLEQNLMNETYEILKLIYIKYLEPQSPKKEVTEKFNANDIFKDRRASNNQSSIDSEKKSDELIMINHKWYIKLLNKIKNFFRGSKV
ncbi:MAG: hypothetical protein J6J36_04885 [Clostridia bacterium]|nr:hypothetical protein [Clostridia bacterium]